MHKTHSSTAFVLRNISRVLLLVILLSEVACTPTCPYEVDEQLLVEHAQELGSLQMSFRPPLGMEMVDLAYTDSVSTLRMNEAPFEMRLMRIYVDTVLSANLSLSDMRHVPVEKTTHDLKFYATSFNAHGQWETLHLQRFTTPYYPELVEIKMQNSQVTLQRVYFFNDKKAQFCLDYYYPTYYEKDYQTYVHSSIASVQPYTFMDINQE